MVELTYLGHSSLKLKIDSMNIYLDPWFNGPTFPAEEKEKVQDNSVILVSHGHFDHFETAFELAKTRQIRVVVNFDLMVWMTMQGISERKILSLNKGGTIKLGEEIEVSMVPAEHSSTYQYNDKLIPGGEPAGYIIKIAPDTTIYYAGDTTVFGDMRLITEFYQPNIAILPVGGLFTMSGKQVAYALDNLLISVKTVIPSHYGTFDFLSGTPDDVKKHLKRTDVEFKIMKVGETLQF